MKKITRIKAIKEVFGDVTTLELRRLLQADKEGVNHLDELAMLCAEALGKELIGNDVSL